MSPKPETAPVTPIVDELDETERMDGLICDREDDDAYLTEMSADL